MSKTFPHLEIFGISETREGDVGAGLSDTGLPTDSNLLVESVHIIDIKGKRGETIQVFQSRERHLTRREENTTEVNKSTTLQ